MIARIHDDGEPKIGSMISLIGLSIRFGKPIEWVRRQVLVNHMGETWEADFYNGGRRRGYKLISRLPASSLVLPSICGPQSKRSEAGNEPPAFMPIEGNTSFHAYRVDTHTPNR